MSNQTFQIAFVISLLVILIVAWQVYYTFEGHQEDVTWVEHSERVRIEVENFTNLPINFSNEIRGSVILRDSIELDTGLLKAQLDVQFKMLDSLVLDNSDQHQLVVELKNLAQVHLRICDQLLTTFTPKNPLKSKITELIEQESVTLNLLQQKATEITRQEQKILLGRLQERDSSRHNTPITLLILTLTTLGMIGFLYLRSLHLQEKNNVTNLELQNRLVDLEQEIEQRRVFQDLLTSVLDSSYNGVMAFETIRDESGKIEDFNMTLANIGAVRITGKSIEEMTSSTMLRIFPGNKNSGLFDKYVQVAESGKDAHLTKFYEYDGLNIWLEIIAVKNGDGIVVTFSDVTSVKQHERDLLEKQEELEDTNYQLEQFAYIASHDLQEPLRKVRAFGDRLNKKFSDKLGEQGQDYISRMQNAAERMQILIDDLLKFSRVSQAAQQFQKVDLNTILREVLIDLEVEVEKLQATIENDELPIIQADDNQMRQLFQNLLSNSLKYSKVGGPPKIKVSVGENLAENVRGEMEPFWKLSFTDNGIGFDQEYSEQIFVIFKRLHGRSEYSGTGIGLAICEKIASNHGGLINAESKKGKGAVFNVFLPKSL